MLARVFIFLTCLSLPTYLLATDSAPNAAEDNSDGFERVFNGKDLSGWKTKGNWLVEENGILTLRPKRKMLQVIPDITRFLWLKEPVGDFAFKLEFKTEPKARSGVFVRCRSMSQYLEVQIADASDEKEAPTRVDCGSLVDVCNPSKKAAKPAGEWNQMLIQCLGSRVEVELNGQRVVEHDLAANRSTEEILTGHLGLQNQGYVVHFRNLMLKRL